MLTLDPIIVIVLFFTGCTGGGGVGVELVMDLTGATGGDGSGPKDFIFFIETPQPISEGIIKPRISFPITELIFIGLLRGGQESTLSPPFIISEIDFFIGWREKIFSPYNELSCPYVQIFSYSI